MAAAAEGSAGAGRADGVPGEAVEAAVGPLPAAVARRARRGALRVSWAKPGTGGLYRVPADRVVFAREAAERLRGRRAGPAGADRGSQPPAT